ncbi:MAG: hypothetical protein V7646_7575 [Pseudonocardia sp.]|jgi:hypothetical protein
MMAGTASEGTSYGGVMGILGELFPGRKISDEAGEAGEGEQWQLGPIDLDNRVVQVQRVEEPEEEAPDAPS